MKDEKDPSALAHLVTAAPDMLAALQAVERASQDDMPPEVEAAVARIVSAAIEKAEGRDQQPVSTQPLGSVPSAAQKENT